MRNHRVVITGMGAVSCLGWGVRALWKGLITGRCGIGPLTRIDASAYKIQHAGQVPAPARPMADALSVEFLLAACGEAVAQARLTPADLCQAGLALASNFGAMGQTERLLAGAAPDTWRDSAMMEGPTHRVADRIALGGIRSTLSLSCASGNATLGYAADLIRSGQARVVLAGGYDAISDIVWAGLCSLRAMSDVAVRPFDRRRDGTIFAEGAGVIVLEDETCALRRGAVPLARFLGYGTSSNAFHMTHPDPDGGGMVRATRGALSDAGLPPEAVDHVNAHATGTPSNDRLETLAIKTVFGERARSIPVTGNKSMLGHAMGAAGALEAIASIQTIREGIIPPTAGLEEADPDCDLDYVPGQARQADVRVVLNNSAGFGGCNAMTLFGRWEGGAR